MNTKYFFVILGLIMIKFADAKVDFTQFYEDGAIRYDFEMVGDYSSTNIIPGQVKQLPRWGGNPNYLIDELDYGNVKYELTDVYTHTLIYKTSFSCLFDEWQTTSEAKVKIKSYDHSMFFPKPKSDVFIEIFIRDKQNEWQTIFIDTLKKTDYFILNERADIYAVDTILYNGDMQHKIDLVILSEGYTNAEFDKFILDAKRLTDSLFLAEPFSRLKEKFNIFALKIPSLESGTDIPGKNTYRNTALNSMFYTFDSPRYLTTSDMKSVYDAVDNMGWDQLYVLVNHSTYGGGGFYNFLNVCSSDNVRSPFVFCHEFGHGFAGLGDEYYTSTTSYEEFYNLNVEPWEPNLTTLVDFKSKWENKIGRKVAIPTERVDENSGLIGVYEGGGYQAKGIYSPMMTCWMKEQSAGGFCPVCSKSIEKVILLKTK